MALKKKVYCDCQTVISADNLNDIQDAIIELEKAETKRATFDLANALRGSASGSSVTIKDISPVEHNIPCSVGSKNLLNSAMLLEAKGWTETDGVYSGSIGNLYEVFNTSQKPLFADFEPNTQYTLTFKGNSAKEHSYGTLGFLFKHSDGTNKSVYITSATETTYTLTSEVGKSVIGLYVSYGESDTAYLREIQLEIGTTATAYTPYVDLSTVKVQRLGKNLFDKNNANIVNGWFATTNGVIAATGITKSVYIPCLPNTTYTASKTASARFYIGFSSTIPKAGEIVENIVGDNNLSVVTSTSPSNAMYLVVWCYHANYDTNISFEQILDSLQIEIGSMATEFEPYIEPTEHTANADGTVEGVRSLYPSMALLSDTDGIIINAEYSRDTNKVINGLLERISALEAAAVNNA